MTILELKKLLMTSKRESLEKSQAFSSILKKVEMVVIGNKAVKVDDMSEDEQSDLILKSARKELKELNEAKTSGAPYNEYGFNVCEYIIDLLSPDMLSDEEVGEVIQKYVHDNPNANMGSIMGYLKTTFGNVVDMKTASTITRKFLQ